MTNYKKASELGLETIQLEDQVLLIDENKERHVNDLYLVKNAWGEGKHEINYWTEAKKAIISGKDKKVNGVILASTKPLEELPLLVIENEVDQAYSNYCRDNPTELVIYSNFKSGYNKAKETFIFTKKDLRNIAEDILDWFGGGRDKDLKDSHSFIDRYIQSLIKKELWIEVERYNPHLDSDIDEEDYDFIPKITNNQIKAVWK